MTSPEINMNQLIDNFARDGFILVEHLLDERQIAQAQAGIEWAMQQPLERYKWIKQRTYEWFREHPIFAELIEHPLVMEFATAWLGPEFHLIAAQCSRNTRDDHYAPGVMKAHQDDVFFPAPEKRAAGVPDIRYGFSAMWYAQDTPLEMGPTELVRGSHISGKNYRDIEPSESELFRQPIAAGSLLIFSHYTWHRGAQNHLEQPRDLITNAYARPEIEKRHLLSPREGGEDIYILPTELLASASPTMHHLLKDPAPAAA